ncbi:hypothetical protein HZS_2905, partial [Henneguya salminicola]
MWKGSHSETNFQSRRSRTSSLSDYSPRMADMDKRLYKTVGVLKQSSDDQDNSPKFEIIEHYKNCITECGISLDFDNFLKSCPKEEDKLRKLKSYLIDIGIGGKITMAACKKYRKRLELANEAQQLNKKAIIKPRAKKLVTRSKIQPKAKA